MKKSSKQTISLFVTLGLSSFLLIGTAYAWFTNHREASVSNIHLDIVESYDLKFSFDQVNYSYNLADEFDGTKFRPVSGNGTNFYKGLFGYLDDGDEVQDKSLIGFEKIEQTDYAQYFYSRDIYFQVDNNIDLSIKQGSTFYPTSKSERKNKKNVSRDYIAGSIRFAISSIDDETNDETPLILWAPNSTYEYTGSAENPIKENGSVESSYSFATDEELEDMASISTNGNTYGSFEITDGPNFVWGNIPDSDLYVSYLEKGTTHLRFSVWIEGTDRECILDLSGGQVGMQLSFTSSLA